MPGYCRVLLESLNKRTSNYIHKRRVLTAMMDRFGVEWKPWTNREKVLLGVKIIDLFRTSTGLIEVGANGSTSGIGRRGAWRSSIKTLYPTDKCLQAIANKNSRDELLSPVLMPMVCPPKPWTNPFDGGLLTRSPANLTLIKTRNRNYLEEVSNWEMPEVYKAVNTLQEVSWRVNWQVLEVAEHFRERSLTLAGLPKPLESVDDVDLPPRPHDIDTSTSALKDWKRSAAMAYEAHRRRISRNMATDRTIYMAQRYQDEPLYYIWTLDFRGRAYVSNSPALGPQGDDLQKGLIEFGDGRLVDSEEAMCWIAIQVANTMGKDKLPLQGRIDYAVENLDLWRRIAGDPINNIEWCDGDKPWQALAAIFDFTAAMSAAQKGDHHYSHLVCAMDGSNNGLQHMSALVLSVDTGRLVNLVPQSTPADIYAVVADAVVEKLHAAVDEDLYGPPNQYDHRRLAAQWLEYGVTRSTVKRPVMTYSYSATVYGMTDQILNDTINPLRFEPGAVNPFDSKGEKAAAYLATTLWQVIEDVVGAAADVMSWLKNMSKLASLSGLPVHWVTPVGFPVQQAYPNVRDRRVETSIAGKRIKLTVREDNWSKIDRRKQQAGISPNYVHSMDASAMIKTVNLAANHGITGFAMVHDSYGTHAADAPTMAKCLREAFVEMYEQPVLEKFAADIEKQIDEKHRHKIPPRLPMGKLDLKQVVDCDFFFA